MFARKKNDHQQHQLDLRRQLGRRSRGVDGNGSNLPEDFCPWLQRICLPAQLALLQELCSSGWAPELI
jgi:hypothetical protein